MENTQQVERMKMIVDYFYSKYDKDVYGITVGAFYPYGDDKQETVYNSGTICPKLFVMVYKKDTMPKDLIKVPGSLSSYGDVYYMKYNYGSGIYFADYDTDFSPTGSFLTTPLAEFDGWISNKLDSVFEKLNTVSTGSGYKNLYKRKVGTYGTDLFIYHSDVDIIFKENGYKYRINGQTLNDGDIWPTYTNWQKNKEPSILDNLTYVCTDKPFFLSEKMNSLSYFKNYEIFDSYIYFDYDIPYDLYPYLFEFYNYTIPNKYKKQINGYPKLLENGTLGLFNDGIFDKIKDSDNKLYTVPFHINTIKENRTVFLGSSRLLEMKVERDEENNRVIDWTSLKDISNYEIDYKSRYFYDFLVYKKFLDPNEESYFIFEKKYKKQGINNLISSEYVGLDNIATKAAFIEYLLTIRNDKNAPDYECFYYDNNNLTFSFATFDENGNPTGTVISNGQLEEITVDLDYDIWGSSNGSFAINDSLKSPLNYLAKMIEKIWNSMPNGLKIVFVSVFTIVLISMFLRMVGYYG